MVHETHEPPVQTDIAGQLPLNQLVHWVTGSSWHCSRAPLAVQRVAPCVQAFWQQVLVLCAMEFSADVNAA